MNVLKSPHGKSVLPWNQLSRLSMAVAAWWVRNDLRLHDNPVLHAATRFARLLPVYVLDDRYLRGARAKFVVRPDHCVDWIEKADSTTVTPYSTGGLRDSAARTGGRDR